MKDKNIISNDSRNHGIDALRLFSMFLVVVLHILGQGGGHFFGGMFDLDDGYSLLWLIILYLAGAWMKKCSIPHRVSSLAALICLSVCTLLTWISRSLLRMNLLLSYTSPPFCWPEYRL